MIIIRNIIAFLYLAAIVTPAYAEVMDKELSVPQVWAWGAVGAMIGVLAIRFRWWVGCVSLPFAALGPLAALAETHDPHVGAAITEEVGSSYGAHALAALLLVLVAHAVTWENVFRQHRNRPADAL